ncbi:MAG: pilus assembly protein PilP [Deltaproteobacteria bacterium]|nr:pilus assembly protein PilP [Deltaproteobacteria bacterium]
MLGDLAGWRDSVEQGYEFKAGSFSDPFMPIESVARPPSKTKGTEQENEVKPIIQQLALNQFTLTAIVIKADRRQSIAMVDSGGKGYMIHEGTLIGNNNGFVREITPDKVIIEEPDTFRAAGNPRVTEFRLNSIQDTGGLEIFKSE